MGRRQEGRKDKSKEEEAVEKRRRSSGSRGSGPGGGTYNGPLLTTGSETWAQTAAGNARLGCRRFDGPGEGAPGLRQEEDFAEHRNADIIGDSDEEAPWQICRRQPAKRQP